MVHDPSSNNTVHPCADLTAAVVGMDGMRNRNQGILADVINGRVVEQCRAGKPSDESGGIEDFDQQLISLWRGLRETCQQRQGVVEVLGCVGVGCGVASWREIGWGEGLF